MVGVSAQEDPEPPEYPIRVNIGVVFPRNETYSLNLRELPVVFAIENAHALFWAGYSIRWQIEGMGPRPNSGVFEAGSVYTIGHQAPLPPDAIGNNWIAANTSYFTDSPREPEPGPFRLIWSLSMSHCVRGGPNRWIIESLGNRINGTVDFSVGNDTVAPVNLTAACPKYSNGITITRNSLRTGSCPVISFEDPDEQPDLCGLRLDQTMADCVMANVTGSDDRSACETLLERVQEDGGSDGASEDGDSSEDGSGDDSEDGGSSDSDSSERDSGEGGLGEGGSENGNSDENIASQVVHQSLVPLIMAMVVPVGYFALV